MGRNIKELNNKNKNAYVDSFGTGNVSVFYQDGTFTLPTGVTSLRVSVWGAGGAGGVSVSNTRAQGGAGGGYASKVITSPSTSYAVTVGAGGATRITAGSGASGGTSSFGSAVSATGGGGGVTFSSTVAVNSGGAGSSGDVNFTGGNGGSVVSPSSNSDPLAFGGGAAAGPWGNGTNQIIINSSNVANWAIGGCGVGGPGGAPNALQSSSDGATGGGGAGGAGFPPSRSNYMSSGGPDILGKVTDVVTGRRQRTTIGNSDFTASNGELPTLTNFYPRHPGEFAVGGGGSGAYQNNSTAVNLYAGNGASGGGGGGAWYRGGASTEVLAGSGGAFGGGGGLNFSNQSSRGAHAGNGGIAAGGGGTAGAGSIDLTSNGRGGNGLVVVEW
jgi:hypothetical protein